MSLAGNCQRRTPTCRTLSRRRALRRSVWVGITMSCCGVSRPAPSCPPPPPHCTAPSHPPPCPHPLYSPPHPSQGLTPPPTATASPSRLSIAPLPTELPPIKISPLDQPRPLTGRLFIIITPPARAHPHTDHRPVAVTQMLVLPLYRVKILFPFALIPLPVWAWTAKHVSSNKDKLYRHCQSSDVKQSWTSQAHHVIHRNTIIRKYTVFAFLPPIRIFC